MRLTYRPTDQNGNTTDSVWYSSIDGCVFPQTAKEEAALSKLADYEDAEKLGRPVAKGKWITKIRHEHYPSGTEYEADYCSACGMRGSLEYNFCPHCGARMEVEYG